MPWLQFHVEVPSGQSSTIESVLEGAGAAAITLRDASDQPLFEPPPGATPLWDHVVLTALFPVGFEIEPVLATIREQTGGGEIPPHRQEILEDRAWEREWLRDFHPMQFGKRLWVCPHGSSTDEPDAVILHLDPGLAFGTGTHPTTAMCLEWLDGIDLRGREVLDFGCGSGILALAALLLGAEKVWAIDNDPQAITATHTNLEANGIPAERLVAGLPGQVQPRPVDVVVANILAGTLIDLSADLQQWTSPRTQLALSGILVPQADQVFAAYQPFVESKLTTRVSGDWACLATEPTN